MILVTGGTGLVGTHLLYHLSINNDEIIAIYRTKKKVEQVKKIFSFYTESIEKYFSKIKWVKADITDITSIEDVFNTYEIKKVYHCAAVVSFNPKDYQKLKETNIFGTENIVNISIDKRVKKICFVSSIATLGDSVNNTPITEESQWGVTKNTSGYAITKYHAEMEVWRASQEGVDIVIVNPSVILGYGFKEGSSKLFEQVKKGLKFYTDGITGFVGVTDVVKVMIQLMNSCIKNERFIISSENKSFKDVLCKIADEVNVKKPSFKISYFVISVFWRLNKLVSVITRKEPIITKYSAESACAKAYYSADKIKTRLNYSFQTIDQVLSSICKKI